MSLRNSVVRRPIFGLSSRYGCRGKRKESSLATDTDTPNPIHPLTSILIANRGEIALSVLAVSAYLDLLIISRRINKTASRYGIKTTTIYTDPDARSQHALSSPYAINLGHPTAYLDGERIIKAAKQQGCIGIHPGYGFVCFDDGRTLTEDTERFPS